MWIAGDVTPIQPPTMSRTPRYTASSAFAIFNCDAPGSIDVVTDAGRGKIWRFRKPAASNRCEAHSFKVNGGIFPTQNNSTYYFAWSSKLSSTVNNNAVFQWKSYGSGMIQNYPVVISVNGNDLTVFNRQPGDERHTPWRMPISANTWYDIVLGIHTSDELHGGWVEIYINGRQQTFSNGAKRWPCRTWDSHNDPKWGVYGAQGTDVDNYIDNLRAATKLTDVLKVAPTPSTPSRSPSAAATRSASPTPSASASPAHSSETPVPAVFPGGPSREPRTDTLAASTPASGGTPTAVLWAAVGVMVIGAGLVALFLRRRRTG